MIILEMSPSNSGNSVILKILIQTVEDDYEKNFDELNEATAK